MKKSLIALAVLAAAGYSTAYAYTPPSTDTDQAGVTAASQASETARKERPKGGACRLVNGVKVCS